MDFHVGVIGSTTFDFRASVVQYFELLWYQSLEILRVAGTRPRCLQSCLADYTHIMLCAIYMAMVSTIFCAGTTFANLDGRRVVDIDYNVTTAFLGCNFTSNFMTEAIISASATAGEGSLVTLERCAP